MQRAFEGPADAVIHSSYSSMRQIIRCLVVVTLAFTSLSSFAQEEISKGDLNDPRSSIDQAPVSVGDVPNIDERGPMGRMRISNALSSSTDPNGERNGERRGLAADEGIPRDARDARNARNAQRRTTSDFQKFVHDSIGKTLPVYGAEFFDKTGFGEVLNTPVPQDYLLGPGDEVLVRGWGTIDIDYRARLDRNGVITLPSLGTIVLGGVKAADAEAAVSSAVARYFKGVTVSVSFGQLRAMTIYVVGQASRPGTYNLSSMSTLVTALFASGGPNPTGSMRHVQVRRGGKVVADLDLYDFIARGDKAADIRLLDGDTIYIPPAAGYVALTGTVNNPAIYELKNDKETIASLLDTAGGKPVLADPRRVFLERIDPKNAQPRTVEEFALDAAGMQRTLKDGDLLNLTSITPDFANAVVLRGNVDKPIRASFKPGMRISDLIPSREFLITRESIQLQNSALLDKDKAAGDKGESIAARIGGLIGEINWDYAVVERINRSDLSVSLLPFNLGNVFANPGSRDNLQLQPGDTVTIFSQKDVAVPMSKRRIFVRVEGEVNAPGVYQMTAGENLQALLSRAGGPTSNAYLFGTAFYREQVRKEQAANLERAVRRLEAQIRNEQSRSAANTRGVEDANVAQARREAELLSARDAVTRLRQLSPTGRIAFGIDPRERSFGRLPQLALENGDRLVIPAKAEFVHVFGAVNAESSPMWKPNSRVNDYLKQVGLTRDADEDNIFILRVDGSVVSRSSGSWLFGGFGGVMVMPGDSIVVPEKFDKETAWTKFMQGTKEWAQIFANFGLGAAAIKTLRD
jgi:protein involved in polysaccharide export with SLBB domain